MVRDHGTLVGATLGWDRDLWRVFGPLGKTPVFDDFPTCFRASLIGDIAYLPEPLLHYRMGGTSSRPEGEAGANYLSGFRIKNLRWHRSFWQAYLEAMEVVAPPDDAELPVDMPREASRPIDFAIGLAEATGLARLVRLPRALVLALRLREPRVLRAQFEYLFDRPYIWLMDRTHRTG